MAKAKTCRHCEQEKPASEFHRNSSTRDGLQNKCKECQRAVSRRSWEQNGASYKQWRNWLRRRKTHWLSFIKREFGCSRCGYNKHGPALHFHHTKDNKYGNLGREVAKFSPATIVSEVRKCVILCANCHAEETWPDV